MKHLRTLDLVASALIAYRKGNQATAADLFAQAAHQPDLIASLRTIEAHNSKAFAALTAAKKKAKTKKKAKSSFDVRASEFDALVTQEFPGAELRVETDDTSESVGEPQAGGFEGDLSVDDEGLDEFATAEADDEDKADAEATARARARMQARRLRAEAEDEADEATAEAENDDKAEAEDEAEDKAEATARARAAARFRAYMANASANSHR